MCIFKKHVLIAHIQKYLNFKFGLNYINTNYIILIHIIELKNTCENLLEYNKFIQRKLAVLILNKT